jgi:hypothetical protein
MCLRPQAHGLLAATLAELSDSDLIALAAAARRQRVTTLVWDRLHRHGLVSDMPPAATEAFASDARRSAQQVLQLHAELGRILERYASLGIPVILLKGAHLGTAVYETVAQRHLGDLDLLIRRDHLAAAAAALRSLGYESARNSPIAVDITVRNHLPRFVRPPVGAVELHWNLTSPNQPRAIDPAALWARARPIRMAGAPALVLSAEDVMLHACLHTSYQHLFGFGVRSLCDVAMLATSPAIAIDWDVLAARATSWGWNRGVYLTLALARNLLGVEVPDATMKTLMPEAVDSEIQDLAVARLFSDPGDVKTVIGVSRLAAPRGFRPLVRHLRERVFVDLDELACIYGISVEAARRRRVRIYLARFWNLVHRHGGTVAHFWLRPNTALAESARAEQRLREWLN